MDSVHPQGGQEVAGDTYYLTLNERQAEDTDSSAIGYDTYDATTDTYTWIVTGRIDGLYSFEEQNYLPPSGSQAQCASYCRVSDAPWQTGSTVSGYPYAVLSAGSACILLSDRLVPKLLHPAQYADAS